MLNVVWFKRDLRTLDHRPLFEASKHGEILPIYITEPSIWSEKDLSARHYQFVIESLADLSNHLTQLGGQLFMAIAEMEDVLQVIYEYYGPFRLFAHQEHGTPETYARDLRVHKWMKERGLIFEEFQSMGVTRRLTSRNYFQTNWEAFMNGDIVQTPASIEIPNQVPALLTTSLEQLARFQVKGKPIAFGQRGGEMMAHEIFDSFLRERYQTYNLHISKPLQSATSCSRLSPYLAWGNISIRYVVQKSYEALDGNIISFYCKQLEAFISRLHWHCHFIQRIEDETTITTTTLNPAFDSLRDEWDEVAFRKWYFGQTGIPLVDAAMRCLHQTGWLNFRSRAMVVSFVCNTLMLDWRRPALGLAQLFLDYEPGIHFSQMQMQSGSTGFNTIRIYNPIKMGKEHDPDGAFIRQFVHELREVPNDYIHEPWLYPRFAELNYPPPMVDIQQANRKARDVLYSVKKSTTAREHAKKQLEKHGSRMYRTRKRKQPSSEQLEFDL